MKFYFLLPTLKSFHGILGNYSLMKLNAIIFTSENYMMINKNIRIQIKQKEYQSVNKLQIRTEYLSKEQITKLKAICYIPSFFRNKMKD